MVGNSPSSSSSFKLGYTDRTMYQSALTSQICIDRPDLVRADYRQLIAAERETHLSGAYRRKLRPCNILCNLNASGVRLANFGMVTCDDQSNSPQAGHTSSSKRIDAAHPISCSRQDDPPPVPAPMAPPPPPAPPPSCPWNAVLPSDLGYAAFLADDVNNLTPAANGLSVTASHPTRQTLAGRIKTPFSNPSCYHGLCCRESSSQRQTGGPSTVVAVVFGDPVVRMSVLSVVLVPLESVHVYFRRTLFGFPFILALSILLDVPRN
ncbi:hypothetical protein R3P38DRAFT_3259087 [Favolaschia claudopus]|uniref:Uncharacterized protein n=1 Tax=Favolaschia claudopus TaxID=2862362 RepID=A0AAW0D114_9AGAR